MGRGTDCAEPPFLFQPLEAPKDQDRKKGKGGKTVSSYFKGQLDDLMGTLYKTEPHFIRCVVPNTHKEPGGVSKTDVGGRCVTICSLSGGERSGDAPVPMQRRACWYFFLYFKDTS